ncbi:hypothetical protein SAMN04489752_0966 [Brevibacterium siliguriense]|uniref:Uncharacterized protein n=1 Tax=Brevibacterium siliguriense TaxID=1136497 RepID=A0A1H1PE17_9MICO|nr:hypothetical protein [Brevibacterium siliguriense]SDS09340.1 hypothetical protein SAMN04489752_0966 [Brevibacterium siliguriense]
MVAGSPHFDIDYRVREYFNQVVGWYPFAADGYVLELIGAAADFLGVEEHEIRRIVWQISRRRLRPNPRREMCPWPYGLEFEAGEDVDYESWGSAFASEEQSFGSNDWSGLEHVDPRGSAAPF